MIHVFANSRRNSARIHAGKYCSGFAILLALGASGAASAATLCVNPGGTSGCMSTISAAVSAASAGDTILVGAGTYKEQVTITKSLSLVGASHNSVYLNATGFSNGIFINGMWAAPNAGVADVLVSGFTVKNATYEGILVANATNVSLVDNLVSDNNRALTPGTGVCNGIPAFETNEGQDCGEGIHLIGVDHSFLIHNESTHNSGGILISDETGPTFDNLVKGNNVHDNGYACGITMASHGPATSVVPTARISFGITHNTIANNHSWNNGLLLPGAGAGVGIFAPFPGTTSSGNVVINNELNGNALPGVTMHNHAAAPAPAPAVNLNDNMIVGNHIYDNAADGADAFTPGPTGINVYSVAPIWGTVIAQNVIENEAVDIAFKAPVGQLDVHFNDFRSTGIGIDNLGAATINATDNWWHCAAGPGGSGCSTAAGAGVATTPWLAAPFNP